MRERIRVTLSAALVLSVLVTPWATPALAESTTDSVASLTPHVYDIASTAGASTTARAIKSATRPVSAPPIASGFNYDDLPNSVATNTIRYGPTNPGPLDDAVAATFRSGSYSEVVLDEVTTL